LAQPIESFLTLGHGKQMSDLHVVALIYQLQLSDNVPYAEPPPLILENEIARFCPGHDLLTSSEKRLELPPLFRYSGSLHN
jgi:hypothetical protein